jgi:phosphoribosylaminoimidazole carboxylase PurE protein
MAIDEKFKEIMKSNKGCAVIMAGSGSDEPHIAEIAKSLDLYAIPYQVRICSAHKQPSTLHEIIDEYNAVKGTYAIVAVAGGTDALSGTASFHALAPVISCPPDSKKYANGINETCLQNPPGSSNVYIKRAGNVGRFIAQMYAGVNPEYAERLLDQNRKKLVSLQKSDVELKEKFGGK